MGHSGLACMTQCWVIGAEGFLGNNILPTLAGYLVWLVWSVWLLIVAWRGKRRDEAVDHRAVGYSPGK